MRASEAKRYLGYLGYDTRTSDQGTTRRRAPTKSLVALSVLCVVILTALLIHAALPSGSSMTAPQIDQFSFMDDTTPWYAEADEDATNGNQSTLLIPGCASLECTGPWYPIFASIGQALLTIPAK